MALRLQRYHGESFWVGFLQDDGSRKMAQVMTVGGLTVNRKLVIARVISEKVEAVSQTPAQANGDWYLVPGGDGITLNGGRHDCKVWIDGVRGRQVAWAIDADREGVQIWRDEVLAREAALALQSGSRRSLERVLEKNGLRHSSGNSSGKH